MSCIDSHEAELLALVNQLRAGHGLLALRPSLALTQAATLHADEMAAHNFMGHTGRNGSSAGDRITAAGYPARTAWGENVAGGYAGALATFRQWRESPGHYANMVSPYFTEIGIARSQGGKYGWVWCQTFGGGDTARARVCGDEGPPPIILDPPRVPDEPAPRHEKPPGRLDGLAARIRERVYRKLGLR